MNACASAVGCSPVAPAWAALLLLTITVYGVLEILSVFALLVHWRDPTRTGARILRALAVFDLVSAAAAPLLIYMVLDAPGTAAAVVIVHLMLAAMCRATARRTGTTELATARLVRR